MFSWFSKLFSFGGGSAFGGKSLRKIVAEINALESEIKDFSNDRLLEDSNSLKRLIQESQLSLDEALPRAFALIREAAKRTLGQRHFDVQLMGGVVLHHGKIAEMRTGEGKTLVATLPVYLNALAGKGVHVVTVNEYLAKRDTVWMGQVYHQLGLSVACLAHEKALMYDPTYKIPEGKEKLIDKERDTTGSYLIQEEYLRPVSRKEAYAADITYGTNHEFGFDYLRDNLVYGPGDQVQRSPNYAIIDEVDSILIDEARTPLIIAAPDIASSEYYKTFARIVTGLKDGEDYVKDEKLRTVEMTQDGINKVEKAINIKDIYSAENLRLVHYLNESLKAHALHQKDRDYVVKGGEIILVDQFTGRLLPGRRFSGGLHQAIEAKEGVAVQNESRTYASISIQNYFRLYGKLAGMTGTAQTSAEEFDKVYKLETVTVPTHRQMIRKDQPDLIYKTLEGKFAAVVADVKERNKKGQPVLIGTVSIEKNERLSRLLNEAGVRHEILNAKNNEREGAIIAQAGRYGAVTVATNLAGRGVDIILGGNPPEVLESQKVKDLGGLHVIGTERHESRRIDNQLRGRAGRQGDPGSSQFFLSLEDDLMRIFGGERVRKMMDWLKVPEDMPISSRVVSRAVSQAQGRVEGANFDARKHLLDYDDVLNKQRLALYKKRQEILETGGMTRHTTPDVLGMVLSPQAKTQVLQMLDFLWMSHLENVEALADSVRLRAYGQHDPLVEYRREGHLLYQQLLADFEKWVEENKSKLEQISNDKLLISNQTPSVNDKNIRNSTLGISNSSQKTGRNDPCPCGSGKKYKKCHGA
ncbi:MAG: Protein translocase subunit SecA [Parcubacteria group bacterium GW2011_GWA1_48_11b]|nr:MAG: Protein translocase subunit SecA [Parcubacteria group bacterium GW2011_GWA1_48_11b]OGY64817.1 MAG: preprotein translocase subunit SecA [Candidatus Harrisonbacteria bacterium RIFCSPHIGHO2_12_FULL_48_16]